MGDECDATTVTGAPQSTGLNTFELATGQEAALPFMTTETKPHRLGRLHPMDVRDEPNTAFNTYYFQTFFPAS